MLSAEVLTCISRTPFLRTVLQCDPISVAVNVPGQSSWDPSSLLATLSQASAVLVAIIGGFLVSRLVAISSEREGIRRLLAAASGRISHIASDLDNARDIRFGRVQRNFSVMAVDRFLEDPQLDLDKLVNQSVPPGTTAEELKPYAVALREVTLRVTDEIRQTITARDTRALKFADLVSRGLKVETPNQGFHERVFEYLRKQLPAPQNLFGMPTYIEPLSMLQLRTTPDWVHDRDARRADEEVRAEADLKTQLKSANAEQDRLKDELIRIGRPVGVLSAIWVLGILSILGIFVPVVVMAYEPKGLEDWAKVALISSFVAGLMAILGYVIWFWRKIAVREEGQQNSTLDQ